MFVATQRKYPSDKKFTFTIVKLCVPSGFDSILIPSPGSNSIPSFNHLISGNGLPYGKHSNTTVSPGFAFLIVNGIVNPGALPSFNCSSIFLGFRSCTKIFNFKLKIHNL